jgi:phosphotransferase system IIB component
VSVDACTTRLRLIVVDQSAVSEPALKALGARGVVKPSDKALQVVLGPIADGVAGEIRAAWRCGGKTARRSRPSPLSKVAASVALPTAADDERAEALVGALGGLANVGRRGLSRLRSGGPRQTPGAATKRPWPPWPTRAAALVRALGGWANVEAACSTGGARRGGSGGPGLARRGPGGRACIWGPTPSGSARLCLPAAGLTGDERDDAETGQGVRGRA